MAAKAKPFDVDVMAANYDLTPLEIKIALNLPLKGEYKAKSYKEASKKYDEEFDKDTRGEYPVVILRECIRLFNPILAKANTFKKAMAAYKDHPPTFWMQRAVGLNLLNNCLTYEQAREAYVSVDDDPVVERKFLNLCLRLAQTTSEVKWCHAKSGRLEFIDQEEYEKECIRKLARLSGWKGM
ncbi:MAG TPA: hypothetical protein PLK06_04165 [bacterium]|nr:hypothetical protein [bacterium]